METKHHFKAEVSQLLDLVIHSLYSKKEIFLRELISNASDAIDRAQYEGLTNKELIEGSSEWQIDLIADKEAKTLTIRDNGIGMTEADVEQNLGMIASSGTKNFLKALQEQQGANAPEMIGQFGVGFYAAFMVAAEVTVVSRHRSKEAAAAVRWHSAGDGSYTLAPAERSTPGTTITLKLRDDAVEYLDEWRLKALVKQYSDFIAYPIRLGNEGKEPAADAEPLNTMKALWKRPKSEVKEEEYHAFYKHLSRDQTAPLSTITIAAEGVVEFRALLFIPAEPPFELLYDPSRKHGLHLYVRNVFIGSEFDALLPEYLRFVRGVVESSDLPLNVSREMLQDDAVIRKIRSNLVGRVLGTLADMKRDKPDDYKKFYLAFGRILKEGFHFDWENKEKLQELALFRSALADDNSLVSLKQYREAMPSTQSEIYYLISESIEAARQSPHLEAARAAGCDVLLLTDAIDQWVVDAISEYDGCKLRALDKGDLELGSDDDKAAAKKSLEEARANLQPLLDFLQATLTDRVREVRLSPRLTDSACCLVADADAMNATMERFMKAFEHNAPPQLRILEINPAHPLISKMSAMREANSTDPQLANYAELLFAQAQLAEGTVPGDVGRFNKLIATLMAGQ
ncbi:MAG: molecular chaperone HtpG [Lentisphaerae bacterium]|jgi:molecular chaperone HtpG|nr:molecular chaperone HtpG [Lentisphaerota bacterium]